jgi:serine protease inhibitor
MRIPLIVASAQEDNADVVMDMANFLWVPRGVAIKGEFARTIQEVFQTRVRDADFSRSEDVRQLVNRRINNMTRGHIQEILPPGKNVHLQHLLLHVICSRQIDSLREDYINLMSINF